MTEDDDLGRTERKQSWPTLRYYQKYLAEGNEENYKEQNIQSLGRNSNPESPEYEICTYLLTYLLTLTD